MTVTVGTHSVKTFVVPVNKTTGIVDANEVRSNDNVLRTAYNTHDADAAIHVQSGTLANRPATAVEGAIYIGTDTALAYLYTGGAWITIGDNGQNGRRWIAVQDTTNQSHTTANTAKLITFNTVDTSYGASLDTGLTNSKLTVTQAGVYNLQWSGQFTNSDSQIHDVDVWIAINGTYLTGSTGTVSVPNKHGSVNGNALPGWNYYLTLTAGQYVQMYWAVSNTAITLATQAATGVHPSTASVLATMSKV